MRTRPRRPPIDHVLIAGGVDDLDAIRALLPLLPTTAYGQVFVEADADVDLSTLAAPPRVTITRLTRPTYATERMPEVALTTQGALLAEAVTAWAAEWIPDEPTLDRIVQMWVGGRSSACVNALCAQLPGVPERL